MAHILVIEDSTDLAAGLANNLEIEGYAVDVAADGESALQVASERPPDLVVLDLMLPGLDGFRVLRELRRKEHRCPVLILTARGEESDKVRGLKLGADDYMTKPFGLLEFLARVEALLRRESARGQPAQSEMHRFGAIELRPASREVLRNGRHVCLTPKEYDLLCVLLRHQGTAISRAALLREVWGHAGEVVSRTVDTHIAELRRKLETDPASPRYILTVRKYGYRLAATPSDDAAPPGA
ncbi:MAG: response regulator transcription factor [Gammaproteobacteria bacterium]